MAESTSGGEFKFDDWVKAASLPDVVVDALKAEGFDLLGALLCMTFDDMEALKLGKQGFLRCLQGAVTRLQAAHGQGPGVNVKPGSVGNPGGTSPDPNQAGPGPDPNVSPLDAILGSLGQQHKTLGLHDDSGAALDPQVYLAKRNGKNCLKIIDFCKCSWSEDDDSEVKLGDNVSLKFKASKPKLDSVSPSMWIAANARICSQLLADGSLDGESVQDYLSYTAKVGDLASRYNWISVLMYDSEYRVLQSAHGFRWGSDVPHLSTVSLKERQVVRQPSRSTAAGRPNSRTGGTKEPCRQYNRGNCTFGIKCIFPHVCSVCGGSHTMREHDKPSSAVRADPAP